MTMCTIQKLAVALLVVSTALTARDATAEEKFKQTFEAFAVAMGTSNPPVIPSGVTATLQINITRWSTDEERGALLTELKENGAKGFVKLLRKQKETGFVRVTGRAAARNPFPSERLRYAREFPREDGSRRIVLAFDRYISFYESMQQPRWRDYDVSLLVMDVDAEGKGVGELAMGVRLEINDENQLVIENFGTEPVRLNKIRQRK